ncbi:MAG TPA: 30S ribosomal protein S6 [Bacteroidota bacterium]|nr:30S ribosomal protein S6 [Bacteroidota bacterium]
MEKENKLYETTFIVNATLDDAQIDAVIEKVKDVIVKNGGEVRSLEKWGRKRLAYTVDKKNNGFYAFFEFKAPGDLIAKLDRHYQLDEQIIRYLTIQLDKKALKAKEIASALQKSQAAAAAGAGDVVV